MESRWATLFKKECDRIPISIHRMTKSADVSTKRLISLAPDNWNGLREFLISQQVKYSIGEFQWISRESIEDLEYWVDKDRKMTLRILKIVKEILRDPFEDIGKPEPLKYEYSGCWSRRVNQEHRLVYLVSENRIDFLKARYHYE